MDPAEPQLDRPAATAAPASLDEVRAATSTVEGWLSDDQLVRLHDAARAVPAGGRIVEIGSFRGRSTIVLAASAPHAGEVVAIDPHAGNDRGPQEIDGFAEAANEDHAVFLANLEGAGVRDAVRHVRKRSDDALVDVDGDVDLLYIDGAHRYAPARDDLQRWGARVRPGGTLLIHDAFSSVGVTLALARTMFVTRRFRYVGRSRSLAEYRAVTAAGPDRLASTAAQVAQLPWFARNLLVKVLLVAHLGRVARLLGHDGETWPY
ncbi:MAG: class I SAM-dependent methyltransferase [Acidimicrobiales bacterium]